MAWRDDDVCHLWWFQCLQNMLVFTFANIRWYWILRRSSFKHQHVRMNSYPSWRSKMKFSSKARSCNNLTECISKKRIASLRTESKNQIYPLKSVGIEIWELVRLWISSDTTTYHSCHHISPGSSPCGGHPKPDAFPGAWLINFSP